jgi:GntR family transcriptional regulator, transcriptional repressor for pyruvate dehydrogenase complex
MEAAEPVAKCSQHFEAARRIRQYITRQGLKPGDQLPTHTELIQHLKVGQRRLREGLSILKSQGMIETRSKGGTIVRRPTVKTLSEPFGWFLDTVGCRFEDLVMARACVESGAAAEAAGNRTARDLLVILDALEQMEALAPSRGNDWAEEEAFHVAILQATHNPVIVTFGQLIRLHFHNVQKKDTKLDPPEWRQKANEQHRSLYESIERQDRTAARDLMYAHITDAPNLEYARETNTLC